MRENGHLWRADRGFTLIELLIVMVIIAILAGIAIPQLTTTREDAVVASIKNDLRNLMAAQEAYYSDHFEYADDISFVEHMVRRSHNVELEIESASGTGWSARGSHPAVLRVCRVEVTQTGATNPECEVE